MYRESEGRNDFWFVFKNLEGRAEAAGWQAADNKVIAEELLVCFLRRWVGGR